jgi:hypothetical protein
MTKMRDYQKGNVYKAERVAFPIFDQVFDLEGARDFSRAILDSNYWREHKGWKRIPVNNAGHNKAGRSTYWHSPKRVLISDPHKNPFVLCHEFAHALTHKTEGNINSGHGRFFCEHYIGIIRELVGGDSATRLETEFDRLGVRY